ncbi:hypothetical protein ACVR0S_07760 [Streptococcus dentapri]|uniref:TIGR04197 family type VII secretion effector n=1 Tax=Streptococcus dentapri TaxID=573564 RepID=A0ABV8CZP4_9STRE
MSSTKKIDTDALANVKNSYEDLSNQITDIGDDTLDATAAEAIQSGNTAIKATAANTKDMLESFDKYLGDVAAAFKDVDDKLAESIGDPTPDTLNDIKHSDSYQRLVGNKKKK